jgi:hypothetical protein
VNIKCPFHGYPSGLHNASLEHHIAVKLDRTVTDVHAVLLIVSARAGLKMRYDKRRKTWNYLWYDGATRRSKLIGAKQEFPTKAAVWKEVERLRVRTTQTKNTIGSTVREVIATI